MTTRYRDAQIKMSRCERCDHDLIVEPSTGKLRCTNTGCKFHREHPRRKHPTMMGAAS